MIVTLEIGSTITKANAFELAGGRLRHAGQGFAPTSVAQGDVGVGVDQAVAAMERTSGVGLASAEVYVNSSAAGGLRMSVHGLTQGMTGRAAREAALGAGAIDVHTTVGLIDADDIDELRAARPNIVLLAGGVDYGEKTTVVANARRLAAAGLDAPVVYAGNAAARTRVLEAFGERGVEVLCADNVFPDVDVLRVEPVRALIHEVFNKHIVRAPGMARLARLSSAEILPTPGAVLLAAEIFANAVGDAVVVDVGGATTDVHSVTDGSPELANKALDPEPRAKRTVEGDLGVFVNARRVAELAGGDEASLEHLKAIPGDEREAAVTRWLAERAVQVAIRRHAGSVADLFTPTGKTQVVRGKDLSAVRWVVGTGGALTRVDGGADILRGVCLGAGSNLLPPPEARVLIDRDYRFSALGTVAQAHPDEVAATFKQWVADQSATPSLEED